MFPMLWNYCNVKGLDPSSKSSWFGGSICLFLRDPSLLQCCTQQSWPHAGSANSMSIPPTSIGFDTGATQTNQRLLASCPHILDRLRNPGKNTNH